ncbi:FadD [Pasteurella multocida subsp. multocida str. Anand1_buffalo]|nr:FadD [Pasteurella multocida subsp. multocida str. Anand1_buffalo]
MEQIAVIADANVSALIVPCFNSLEEYAKQLNIKYHDRLELIKHSDILQMFEQRINDLQKELPSFEQIKKFTLLPQAFTTKNGRNYSDIENSVVKVILERYKAQIEAMYKESLIKRLTCNTQRASKQKPFIFAKNDRTFYLLKQAK